MIADQNSVRTISARFKRALMRAWKFVTGKVKRGLGWLATAHKSPVKMVAVLVVSLLLLTGVCYAGYNYVYIPNNPNALWAESLKNTAKGTDMLLKASEKPVGTVRVEGTYSVDASKVHADGSFSIVGDDQNATGHFDVGAVGLRVNAEFAASQLKDSANPDLYVKVDGLKGIGGLIGMNNPKVAQTIDKLNGQWISIDHTYLDKMDKTADQPTPDISEQEAMDAVLKLQAVNKQYLFESNKDKAVLLVQGKPNKELHNGRKTYHYDVGLNKVNTRQYVTEVKRALSETKIPKLMTTEEYDKAMETIIKSTDKINESDTVDVWVDRQTHLIRSIRFADSKKPSEYIEIGLNYNGGQELPFYLTAVATENGNGRADLSFVYNMKQRSSKTHFEAEFAGSGQRDSNVSLRFDMTTSESEEKFEFKKPDNARPVQDVISELQSLSPGAQVRGATTEDNFLQKILAI